MSDTACFVCPESGFTLDCRNLFFPADVFNAIAPRFAAAHQGMLAIERGDIKNPDENRKVTHFTDRMAYPDSPLFAAVEAFAEDLRTGRILGGNAKPFTQAVINGIGGSALGPQLMQFAVNGPYWNELSADKRRHFLKIYFLDNTDPAGVHDLIPVLDLEQTLVVNISKSGGTQETRNNMIALENAYAKAGLSFAAHACAITMAGSKLDRHAREKQWLKVFEMADSIGGRTSETSIVGHLPAALAGIDFRAFLKGACEMDGWTRNEDVMHNPAYYFAACWYILGEGKGNRNMVIVPYADRLILLSRYLQQLVMESLGKALDLDGKKVEQGLNVFGNKGGTDAHAFIQQLHDGRDDFFAVFVEVLRDAENLSMEGPITMGDYLHGFETGLVHALKDRGRNTIEIKMRDAGAANLGRLIALFERAVAFYAELIHINAFHQPGVQAYKLAAGGIIELTRNVLEALPKIAPFSGDAAAVAAALNLEAKSVDDLNGILAKFAENPDREFAGFTLSRTHTNGTWTYTVSPR